MKNNIDDGYSAIRERFIEKLKGQLSELEKFRAELDVGNLTNENLIMYIHKLAGSAKTFGFPELNKHASVLDRFFGDNSSNNNSETIPQNVKTALDSLISEAKKIVKKPVEVKTPTADIEKKEYDFHIMVVDDDELISEQIKLALSMERCRVTLIESGLKTLEYINNKNELPDVILLDINMEEMNGFELLEHFKKEPELQDIPIVMITARDTDEDLIRGIRKGAVDYISKPFETSELVKKVINIAKKRATKILIADDDELICALLKQRFYRMGYKVLVAKDGVEALNKMLESRIDIAILDIMMPGMNGLSVLRHIRENKETADIPVIILTAKNQQENVLEGLETGAYDYITKPFDMEEVAMRVSGILHRVKRY